MIRIVTDFDLIQQTDFDDPCWYCNKKDCSECEKKIAERQKLVEEIMKEIES
jgi:hypothetical protein